MASCLHDQLPDRWYRSSDPCPCGQPHKIIEHELEAHGTLRAAAHAHDVKPNTVNQAWAQLGLKRLPAGPRPKPLIAGPSADDERILQHIKKARARKVDPLDLADQLDLSPRRVREAIIRLREQGFRIDDTGGISLERVAPDVAQTVTTVTPQLFDGKLLRVGVVSDTHLGAHEQALEELECAYDVFDKEGIREVWHAGDWGTGVGMFKTHHAEANVHTGPEQVDYLVQHYPRRKRIITRGISGNHDLEGDFGRIGFDPIHALAQQRPDIQYLGPYGAWLELRPGTGSHVHLLHGSGGMSYAYCHSADTEILTETNGWVAFPDIKPGQRVATLSADGFLEWQEPTDYHSSTYWGDLIQFGGGRTSGYDLLVTPDHRMWARRPHQGPDGKGWQFVAAKDINARGWVIKRDLNWTGTQTEAPFGLPRTELAALLGWYIAEGSCNPANNQIQIAQNPGSNYDQIAGLIETLGFTAGRYERTVCFSDKTLADYLKQFGRQDERFVPDWIKHAEPELIDSFLTAYWSGDGTTQHDRRHSCTTISRRLADDIQELLLKTGYTSCVQRQEPSADRHWPQGRTTPVDRQRARYVITAATQRGEVVVEKEPARVPYEGLVYCVTVPNGIILTRRNGKPAWSGNSYKAQKLVDGYPAARKPAALIVGHWHVRGDFLARGVHVLFPGCFEWQSRFMQRLGLQPAVGFHILELWVADDGSIVRWRPEWRPFYPGRKVAAA